ncbi:interleukin-1 receptor-associated kinase 4 [Vigna unguiculata]|uniref:Interleukin-1 receptor-associated kinase 4 n=1 Tax=Vigna unguiculata TaxID=3917 RepID=A0A4D6M258_VIGUN|nr:interleukin-1 receptor-associated kinase 4 [Vigna unguiculata]
MVFKCHKNKCKIASFDVVIFTVATLLCFSHSALSDPRISEVGLHCGTHRASPSGSYVPIFTKEMEKLQELVSKNNWGTHSEELSSTTPIYGLAQCFQDLSNLDCLQCFAASRTKLPRCLPSVSGHIYLDGCFLRYDNYSFYTEESDPLRDTVNCTTQYGAVAGEAERLVFGKSVGKVVENVVRVAVNEGRGFAVGEGEGVYALAQCWKSVGEKGCGDCLKKAENEVKGCLPKKEGRALNSGCYLRFSTVKFFNQGGEHGDGDDSSRKRAIITAVSVLAAIVVVLSILVSCVAFTKKRKKNNFIEIPSYLRNSSLNYKYETLEKATDYFSTPRKIGQGGAGSVFKGTLPNGKDVAVKRLVFNNRQWVDDFFNEVNLISGINHKNLVKLLGCSIEGPESLIVYEYLPNKSLDHFIFEKDKTRILKWKQRFEIILGIAEGLAYLHGGSEIRIIHRDIKSSNVLLDENLNPKIADFGLARCFGADKTHLSTGIAGTLGYMAPEYLIQGQLTDKADVYSFGVLVLETASGRKNNVFREDSGSLLQTVWKLYQSNRLAEAVDPCLEDDFPEREASRVFQIGLLCTQASASLRPSMAQVACMLSNSNLDVPIPKQPPFLNSRLLSQTAPLGFSIDNSSSNTFQKIGVSYSPSQSSSSCSLIRPSKSEETILEA